MTALEKVERGHLPTPAISRIDTIACTESARGGQGRIRVRGMVSAARGGARARSQ